VLYDSRTKPDPSTIRGRYYFAVDGRDATAGHLVRAVFEAPSIEAAAAIAIENRMCGELFEVPSSAYPAWVDWANSLIRTHTRIILPRPPSGIFLGTLERQR
jgi:hypothetical protein